MSVLAAAVAFFAFLATFPALIAGISLWGLVVDQSTAARQAQSLTDGLPADAAGVLTEQLDALATADSQALGVGFVVTVALALWSASGGVAILVKALNVAYDVDDDRGYVKTRAVSLALTLGAIVFVVLSVALLAVLPALVEAAGLGPLASFAAIALRWLVLFVLVVVSLTVVYRVAPDRPDARLRWRSKGVLGAAALWLLGSVGFSLYVSSFGSYGETYGSLAGVAVLLLWLYMTAFIVLIGAEVDSREVGGSMETDHVH